MHSRFLALSFVIAFVAAACGGGSSDGGEGGDCVDLSTGGETFTVRIANFAFAPSCFTASASQGISIVNEDGADHTFTLRGTGIDVRVPGEETVEGEPVSGVVAPGTYDLVCTLHPEMTGDVTVVE